MEIPDDVSRKIFEMDVSRNARRISETVRGRMVPHKHGAVSNPFFCCGEEIPKSTFGRTRTVLKALPRELIPLYESYTNDTEFRIDNIVFLSEEEAKEAEGWTDFAITYAGMGHVTVYAYLPERDVVLSCLDGGANGYDREENNRLRLESMRRVRQGLEAKPSPYTHFPTHVYSSFQSFWEEVVERESSP